MKLSAFKDNLISLLILSILLTGCSSVGLAHDSNFTSNYENTEEVPENIYVCSAEVVYGGIDVENQIMAFHDTSTGEELLLNYDGTTIINDKYGQPLTATQLNKGDILNIAYSSSIGKVGAIVCSPAAFCISDITKYSVTNNGQTLNVGDDAYFLTPNVKIYSYGQIIPIEQLINNDSLTIQGRDHNIYSIQVDNGHGYLSLINYDALIGGWIEIGQTLISQVTDDMLFTVPEGTYSVHLTNSGIDEYRDIVIARNEIALLDLGDIESVMPDKGIVSFNIFPENSTTYLDGDYINTAYTIRVPVGLHEVTSSAPGYATVTQFINVDGSRQSVYMDLEVENNTVSGNSINKNMYASVTIESPSNVEVYVDNIYKGESPISFKKVSGTHILTFKKYGYMTTSYNVYFEDDGKDEKLSFADLISESAGTVSGNSINTDGVPTTGENGTVSGNSVSGNSLSPSPSPSGSITPSPSPTPIFN